MYDVYICIEREGESVCCECVNYFCTTIRQRMGRDMGSEGGGVQNMTKHAPQMFVKVRVVCMYGVVWCVWCVVALLFFHLSICQFVIVFSRLFWGHFSGAGARIKMLI